MAFLQCEGHGGLLDAWVAERGVGPTRPAALVDDSAPGLRFAFYGRTSTADHQDSASSRGWQREIAEAVIAGHGVVTDVFFDVGCSRRVPWARRPAAGALLAALRMERRFDAVVVGEYERAFASGDQFTGVAAVLAGLGVEVWLPEAGGRVDVDSPAHAALVTVLGAQSQREVLRSRHRVRAAMWTQAREQGRYLGGRPPYGYRLVDAGPHPNRAHAGWGRRLRRLDPDPVTSPHVRWIFAQRLAGRSVAGIARELTERKVPCPSDVDPNRNRHRLGGAWPLRTVAVILGNPRYTGRQVWDRQRTERIKPGAGRTAHRSAPGEWAISSTVSHPPLVTEAEFVTAQQVRATRPSRDGHSRCYVLAGLLRCAVCGRRLDSHWVHGRAGYRCRHGHSSARPRRSDAAKNIYVREDVLLRELASRLLPNRTAAAEDGVAAGDVAGVADSLRAAGIIIRHDGRGWDLATA